MNQIKPQSISASSRWLTCTASLQYNKDFNENVHALKGNLVHDVSELRLNEIFNGEDNSEKIKVLMNCDYVSENDPTLKTSWDMDCQKTYEAYIEYAVDMANRYKPHTIILEKKQWVNLYGFKKYGYIDLLMISDDYIIIIDLKSGRSKVEAEENSQMLIYAIGMLQDMKDIDLSNKKVIIAICQSLINNIVSFEYSIPQIAQFYNKQQGAFKEIINNELVYRPSAKACKFCDFRKKCNERIKKGVV